MEIGHNSVSAQGLTNIQKETLKKSMKELNDSMFRISAERELIKETIEKLHAETGLEKKAIRKMARTYYNANFSEEVSDFERFQELYLTVIGGDNV